MTELASPALNQKVPIVAIVGRPNVGKSALFNRLVRERRALVEDEPGTTRDRIYAAAEWAGQHFTLIDTGGLEDAAASVYAPLVKGQIEQAVREADVILFLVDVRDGLTATDLEIAQKLRESQKPLLLLANKADNEERELNTAQFYELGLGEPLPVSAYHGRGVAEALDRLVGLLLPYQAPETDQSLRLTIVGRPNVGKSMLLNNILGQERVIVSEMPGTTRDAIDTSFTFQGQPLTIIDTAGIRRRGRITPGTERHSVLRAERALERCDVALLVMDASEGVTAQDTHIAGAAAEGYKGLVLVMNKIDLLARAELPDLKREVRKKMRFLPWAPLCFTSALRGEGVDDMLALSMEAGKERQRRVPTGELNAALQRALAHRGPPTLRGRGSKLFYVTQPEVSPPTFVFFGDKVAAIHFSYRRYLENRLREAFGFRGTAIRLVFRDRNEN